MKGNHWFIAGIIVFLVLMFAIECRLPKNFVWKPTFGHHDEQPFGCAVFDTVLSSSLPQGYTFSRKSLYQLEQEDTTLRRGILVVTDNLHLTDVDVEAMLKMAGRGDRIMLAGSSFSRILKDTLGVQLFLFQSVGFEKICHCIAFERQFVLGGGFGGLSAADFLFLSPTLSVLFLCRFHF